VLFESPRRVAATLEEVVEVLGDRRVALARELTKVHEEVVRGTASEVLAEVRRRDELKGEVALVVEGAAGGPASGPPMDRLVTEARELAAGGMRKREAAAEVARRHGASANAIYRELIGGVPPP
jgi:16S rRNA (cytidine1402-2'-O)-methyltransferase